MVSQDLPGFLDVVAIQAPKSITANNNGTIAVDLSPYVGKVDLIVSTGVQTAANATGVLTLTAATSADNNGSNATNYGTTTATVTNNGNAAVTEISVDTRDAKRYLFLAYGIASGLNTPAWPISGVVVAQKQVAP